MIACTHIAIGRECRKIHLRFHLFPSHDGFVSVIQNKNRNYLVIVFCISVSVIQIAVGFVLGIQLTSSSISQSLY